jgi:hypothetical protein
MASRTDLKRKLAKAALDGAESAVRTAMADTHDVYRFTAPPSWPARANRASTCERATTPGAPLIPGS